MKKKMKKILSLGTVALALSPMAGVVACGSSSSKTPVNQKLADAKAKANQILDGLNIQKGGWKTGDKDKVYNALQDQIKESKSKVNAAKSVEDVKKLVESPTQGTEVLKVIDKVDAYNSLDKYRGTLSADLITKFNAIKNNPTIAYDTFQNATALTAIDLKSSVTIIEDGAFENAPLTFVNLPDSLTTIGASAFKSALLIDLTTKNNVTSIGANAFESSQLTSLTLSNALTTIGASAFASSRLISLTIPDKVTSIGDEAFKSSPLENLTVSKNVTSIGTNTFQGVVNETTTNVTMPWLFQDDDNKKRIFALTDPAAIKINFIYPDKPKPIVPATLAEAQAAANTIIDGLNMSQDGWKTDTDDHGQAWSNFEGAITKARTDISNATTIAEVQALVTSKTKGTSVESVIPKKATYTSLNKYKGDIQMFGAQFNAMKKSTHIGKTFQSWTQVTDLIIMTPITSIADDAFGSAYNMKTLVFPNSLTSIGHNAFSQAKLTTLIIPQNVTSIGNSAFEEAKLTSLTIPNKVTSIGTKAFFKSPITSVIIPNSVKSIGTNAFENTRRNATISIPRKFQPDIKRIFDYEESDLNITYT